MRSATLSALLCAGVLGGCGTPLTQLIGVPPSLQQSGLVAEQDLQDRMVDALIKRAGLTTAELRANPALWKDVADAGLVEVDIQCDRYLAALFTFNREQRAGRQILTAAGASTAAILGLTGAAGATVALVAASFGLAANVFDAGANSVLFSVSPTAIRAVAVRGRQAFLEGIKWERVNSRPRMMMVVQGYLAQCTPAAIEANIDNAATGAPSVSNIDTAIKAAALASPSSSVLQDSSIFIATPVAGPKATPPSIPPADVPGNVTKAESEFIRTKGEASTLQSALGTKPDGDLGAAGLATPGATRLAISEYNTGLLRRTGKAGPGGDVMDGRRDVYRALAARGPLSLSGVNSPFERAFLGDQPTCFTIRSAMTAINGPVITQTDAQECMTILRTAIRKRRSEPGMPRPLGREDALDSPLFDAAPPSTPIPDPPAKP